MFWIKSPFLLFILISSIIIFVWFRQGLMYGGAEVGILTYNPKRFLEIQQYIWWGAAAPGMLVPHFITGIPFYFVLSLIQNILSPTILQAGIFFFLLFLMGYGMYLFSLAIFGTDKKFYAVLAGIFYMFNSYTMVMIWHRFLYTGFFLAAFLPFIALFWRKWIGTGQFLFLVLFLLTNLISSYMFANLASILTVWLLILLMTTSDAIFPLRKNELIKIGLRFFLGAFFWLVTNIWWLIPSITISPTLLAGQHSSENSIATLINISKQTILPYTLQFANPFYLFQTAELGQIYKNPIFLIIPWLPALIIFIGLLASFKQKYLTNFGIAYLLAILLSKGAASPFGYPYIWAFVNIDALGLIRNPFEKLGILLPFFGSILFVIGIADLLSFCTKKFGLLKSQILITIIFAGILIYAWPMFAGKVISKPKEPLLVQVPESFRKADEWIKSQKIRDGNILHLPFSKDVVTYKWEHGYHGVEINEMLFTSLPSITRNVGFKRADDTLESFIFLFNKPFSNNRAQVLQFLQKLNVRYIILHKDVDWNDTATYGKDIRLNNPSEIEASLNNFDFLEKTARFGDLTIYRLNGNFYQPKIVLFNTASLVYPGASNIMALESLVEDRGQVVTPVVEKSEESLLPKIEEVFVFPKTSLDYSIASESALINMANSMLLSPKESNLVLYLLNVMKNTFLQAGELNSLQYAKESLLAHESLVKYFNLIRQPAEKVSSSTKIEVLDVYQSSLNKIFNNNLKTSSFFSSFKTQIANIFYLHLYILEQISKQGFSEQSKILEIQKNLIEGLKTNNLLPNYLQSYLPQTEEINRKVLQFKAPVKSKYELVMTNRNLSDLYPNLLSELDIRINDVPLDNKGKIDKNIISFGDFNFDEGNFEISYNSLISTNLVPSLDKFLKEGHIESKDSEALYLSTDRSAVVFLESPIKFVTGGDTFKISIDTLFKKGIGLYIEIISDSEEFDNQREYQIIKSGECSFHSCYHVGIDPAKTGWQTYTFLTPALNLASQKASVRILFISEGQNSQQNPAEILIKNFRLQRVYKEDLILRKKLSVLSEYSPAGSVMIDYQTPVIYSGKIRIDQPSFLFFKETFHPGWALQLNKENKIDKIDTHFLGNLYGNVWFVEKPGDYHFKVEFEPQRYAERGLILTTAGWILVLIMLLWFNFRKNYDSI